MFLFCQSLPNTVSLEALVNPCTRGNNKGIKGFQVGKKVSCLHQYLSDFQKTHIAAYGPEWEEAKAGKQSRLLLCLERCFSCSSKVYMVVCLETDEKSLYLSSHLRHCFHLAGCWGGDGERNGIDDTTIYTRFYSLKVVVIIMECSITRGCSCLVRMIVAKGLFIFIPSKLLGFLLLILNNYFEGKKKFRIHDFSLS